MRLGLHMEGNLMGVSQRILHSCASRATDTETNLCIKTGVGSEKNFTSDPPLKIYKQRAKKLRELCSNVSQGIYVSSTN
jgi:hypothetical protein